MRLGDLAKFAGFLLSAFALALSVSVTDDHVQSVSQCVDKVQNIAQNLGRAEMGLQADQKKILLEDGSTATTFTITLNWLNEEQAQLVYKIKTMNIPGKLNFPTRYCVIQNITLGN